MTLQEALNQAKAKLVASNINDIEHDAFAILEFVTGISCSDFFLRKCEEISEDDLKKYNELIELRATRIPLQHITKSQNFYGYDFYVDENVLVPRQDTEVLIEKVLEETRGETILDMCTGSGCIAITLYLELKKKGVDIDVSAVDISKGALDVTLRNAKALIGNDNSISQGKENEEEALFHIIQSDLFSNLDSNKKYDIIVSNPPYIPTKEIENLDDEVRLHDPYIALDGDEDGLKFYRKIISEAKNYLNNDGYICFEIGYDEGLDVTRIMEENGYYNIRIYKDLAGLDRVVIAQIK